MTEKELRPVVVKWLEANKLYVAHEVMLCGFCDLIGCLWAKRIGRRIPSMLRIVAVELKINDIAGVLEQAITNKTVVDYSYIAMPYEKCANMRPNTLKKIINNNIGLLAISKKVEVWIPPKRNDIIHSPDVCRRLWNFKIRHIKNRVGSQSLDYTAVVEKR